jgi:glycine cleavage system H protein
MSATPSDRHYTKSHEWVKVDGADLVVGITDHAQSELTDIVFVDLPKTGKTVAAGDSVLALESVKTVSDVYAPAAGTVVAVNEALKAHPELVNKDPYGAGWVFKIKPSGKFDTGTLWTAQAYDAAVAAAPASH